MPINNKTNPGVVAPRTRNLRRDADVVAEAVRYLGYLDSDILPQCRQRCEESEQLLAEQEILLSEMKEDEEIPEDELEEEIRETGEEMVETLEVFHFDQDDLILMENNFTRLGQILVFLEARSAGLNLSVSVDFENADVPPGIRSHDYAYAQWESGRQSQLVTASLDRACIAELRNLLSTAPLDFLNTVEEGSDVEE